MSESNTDFIQTVADKLSMALESEAQSLMELAGNLAQSQIVNEMLLTCLGVIDRLADSEIRAAQLGA